MMMMKHSIGSRATTRKGYSRCSNNKKVRKYSGTKKASLAKERRTQGVGSFAAIFGIQPFFTLCRDGEDKAPPPPLLSNKLLFCQISFKTNLYLRLWTLLPPQNCSFFLSLIGFDITWTLYEVFSRELCNPDWSTWFLVSL